MGDANLLGICVNHYNNKPSVLHQSEGSLCSFSSNFLLCLSFCSSKSLPLCSLLSQWHFSFSVLIFFCLYRPTPKVEWKKKDGVLANTAAHVINFDRWLHFDSITLDDVGEYECKAFNTHGSTTYFFTVTVEGRPLTCAHRNKQVWLWCSAERQEVISMLRSAGFNKTVSKLGRGRDIVIYVTIILNNWSTILKMHFENCRMHFRAWQENVGFIAQIKPNTAFVLLLIQQCAISHWLVYFLCVSSIVLLS